MTQFQIYPKNDTKIARIVQEIVRGREEPPSLEGKAPLEILVEIGIEKLMRDYVHAFLCKYKIHETVFGKNLNYHFFQHVT